MLQSANPNKHRLNEKRKRAEVFGVRINFLTEEVCSKKKQTFGDWINFLCIYLFWWTAAISFRHKILLRINQQNQPAKNTIPIIMFTPSNTKYMLQNTKPNKNQLKSEMQMKTGGCVWSKHHFLYKGEVHKELRRNNFPGSWINLLHSLYLSPLMYRSAIIQTNNNKKTKNSFIVQKKLNFLLNLFHSVVVAFISSEEQKKQLFWGLD